MSVVSTVKTSAACCVILSVETKESSDGPPTAVWTYMSFIPHGEGHKAKKTTFNGHFQYIIWYIEWRHKKMKTRLAKNKISWSYIDGRIKKVVALVKAGRKNGCSGKGLTS